MGNFIRTNLKGRLLVFILVLFVFGWVFYRDALYALFLAVLHREGSSHGIFVPFLSGYFLWLKFYKLKEIKAKTALLPSGAMLLFGVLLLFFCNFTGNSLYISILSFLCIAGALLLVLFGIEMFKETAFPLFFLATMIPVPLVFYKQVADWMRLINTWGSVVVTKVFGVPLYNEGFDIYLPKSHLYVAMGCSGIRYLLSYFVFSIVYAALFKQRNFHRLIVILGSIPLAVVAGITRLSVIFLAAHYITPVMAEPRPHIILSWVVFTFFLFGVIGVDQYVARWKGEGVRRRAQGIKPYNA